MDSIMLFAGKIKNSALGIMNSKMVRRIAAVAISAFILCYFVIFSIIKGTCSPLILTILFFSPAIVFLRSKKQYARIFVWAYLLSVLFTIALYHIYIARYSVPYYNGGSDDLRYESLILDIAGKMGIWNQNVINSIVNSPNRDYLAFIYPLVQISHLANLLGGANTYDFRLFNCLLNALCSLMIFRLCSKHLKLSDRSSTYTALLCSCAPFSLYITANMFRDVWVTFLMLVIVLSTRELYLSKKFHIRALHLATIAVMLYLLFYSRMLVNWLMIFFVAVDVFWIFLTLPKAEKKVPIQYTTFILSAVLAVGMLVYLFSTHFFSIPRITEKISYINDTYTQYYHNQYPSTTGNPQTSPVSPPKATAISNTKTTAPSVVNNNVRFSDKVLKMPLPAGLALRYPMLMVTPLPRFTSWFLDEIFYKIGTCIRFFVIPFLLYGIFMSLKKREMTDVAGLFTVSFLIIGATTFTFRHIYMMYPFAAVTSAQGYHGLADKPRIKKKLFWISLSLLLLYQLSNFVF